MARICKEAEHDMVEFSTSSEMRNVLRSMTGTRYDALQSTADTKAVLTEEEKVTRLR